MWIGLSASEWVIKPSRNLPLELRGISNASKTISVRMVMATRHPTIMPLKASRR
jgi:hypothetical protein